MKKIIFLLALVLPFLSYSQKNPEVINQVKTLDGIIYSGEIESFQKNKIYFYYVTPELEKNVIGIENVSIISGSTPAYRMRAILKANPNVQFILDRPYIELINNTTAENEAETQYYIWPGDCLIKAGTRYLTGIGVGIAGGYLTIVGIQSDREELRVVGGITALVGAIISVSGHIELIKAGKALNEAVTVSAASEGVGFAINF